MIKKILQSQKKVEYCRPLLPYLNNSVITTIVFTNLCLWFEMLDTDEFVRPIKGMQGLKLLSWEQELGITEKTFLKHFSEVGQTFSSKDTYEQSKSNDSYFYMYLDDKEIPHFVINREKVEQFLLSVWSFSPYLNLSVDGFEPVVKKKPKPKLDLKDCLNIVEENLDKIDKFKSEINWDEVQRICKESYKNGFYKSKEGHFNTEQLDTVIDRCLKYNKDKQLLFKDKIEKEKLTNTEKATLTSINLYGSLRTFISGSSNIFFTEEADRKLEIEPLKDNEENINKYF